MVKRSRLQLIFSYCFAFSLALSLVFLPISDAYAQQPQPSQGQSKTSGTRRSLATIVFCGLGGAVLGLSTLSFYGRPQDHMNNIGIGFAVGIIAGTIYVTIKATQNPSQLYDNGEQPKAYGTDISTYSVSNSIFSPEPSYNPPVNSRSDMHEREFRQGAIPLLKTSFEF